MAICHGVCPGVFIPIVQGIIGNPPDSVFPQKPSGELALSPRMIQRDRVEVGRSCAVQKVNPGFLPVVLFPVVGNLRVVIVQNRQPDVNLRICVGEMVVNLRLWLLRHHQLQIGSGFFEFLGIPGHGIVIVLILGFVGHIVVGFVKISQAVQIVLQNLHVIEPFGVVCGTWIICRVPVARPSCDAAERRRSLII